MATLWSTLILITGLIAAVPAYTTEEATTVEVTTEFYDETTTGPLDITTEGETETPPNPTTTVRTTEVYTTPKNPYWASACGQCNISDVWLDIIFAVDSSESMTRSGVFAVQATVRTIMRNLQLNRTIVRAGVVAYSDKAHVAYPLDAINSDDDVYSMAIPFLGGYGTNMEAAIVTSMALFNDYPSLENARQVIVFFSSTYREGPYKSPKALSTAFQNETGVIMTVDYTPLSSGNNPMLGEIASPGYQFIKNENIAEQMGDGFCDANCFCPMRVAGYTKGMGSGCSGDRCTPTGGCYSAVTIPAEWKAAEMDCIDNDGHLASVHELDEQTFLINQFAPKTQFWIGFNTYNYTWTDGYFYDYSKWYSPGQPSSAGFCTYSQQYSGFNSAWYTANCRNDLQYVCSVKPCSALNRNCSPVGVRKQRKLH